MSIFKKDKSKRKEKRGIVPVVPEKTYPSASYWDTYETPADEVEYVSPEPSYDRSPTTYDTPAPSSPSQSYDNSSSGSSGGSYTSDSSSSSSGDSGGSW